MFLMINLIILPYVNTFLYDIKVMDPELHKKYIGVDNRLILENLVKLSNAGARIYIRIPTIKEVNGNEQNMTETIRFLKEHDIHPAQVNLLPYHDTGSGKYAKLDMEYKGTDLHTPSKEEMESFVQLFKDAGFQNTKIGEVRKMATKRGMNERIQKLRDLSVNTRYISTWKELRLRPSFYYKKMRVNALSGYEDLWF